MILDANGDAYRTAKRIGFHGHASEIEECDVSFDAKSAKLPKWTHEERSDDPVAATHRHGGN